MIRQPHDFEFEARYEPDVFSGTVCHPDLGRRRNRRSLGWRRSGGESGRQSVHPTEPMTPSTLTTRIRTAIAGWRYRVASRLLGEQWYIPRTQKERAYIVVTATSNGIGRATAIFPAKTLELTVSHDLPSFDEPDRRLAMTGAFSGTIGEDE